VMSSAIANPVNELSPKLEARLGEDGGTAEKGGEICPKFVQVAVEGLKGTGVAGFEPATNGLEVRGQYKVVIQF